MSNQRQDDFIAILKRGGAYKLKEIAEELDIDDNTARHTLRAIRYKCIHGKGEVPWIHITPEGYSLTTNPAAVIKEANMRIKMAVGIYMNSAPVFQKAQRIASAQFEKLKIQHKPAILKLGKLI